MRSLWQGVLTRKKVNGHNWHTRGVWRGKSVSATAVLILHALQHICWVVFSFSVRFCGALLWWMLYPAYTMVQCLCEPFPFPTPIFDTNQLNSYCHWSVAVSQRMLRCDKQLMEFLLFAHWTLEGCWTYSSICSCTFWMCAMPSVHTIVHGPQGHVGKKLVTPSICSSNIYWMARMQISGCLAKQTSKHVSDAARFAKHSAPPIKWSPSNGFVLPYQKHARNEWWPILIWVFGVNNNGNHVPLIWYRDSVCRQYVAEYTECGLAFRWNEFMSTRGSCWTRLGLFIDMTRWRKCLLRRGGRWCHAFVSLEGKLPQVWSNTTIHFELPIKTV